MDAIYEKFVGEDGYEEDALVEGLVELLSNALNPKGGGRKKKLHSEEVVLSEGEDKTSLTEPPPELIERKLYPEAIAIGMPSEEFWDGKPSRFWSYVEAYKLRMERTEKMQSSLIDYQSWLTGLYVHNAPASCFG